MNERNDARVSIVAACRNEGSHIGEFLETLLDQDMGGMEWEALIADGMSDDGTRRVLELYASKDARIRLIENPGRIVSTGLNAAIRASRGQFVLRMDAHTRYARTYCHRCIETLVATGADNAGGPARTEARGARAKAIAGAYHSRLSTGGGKFHDESYEGWVDTVPYGCWRREIFDRIGLLDETLVRNQDDEFNLRLIRAGGKIWQNPRIVSWYSPRATLGGLFRQYLQYGFWKVAVIRKHRIPGSWRHLVPMAFVLANIALPMAALVSWMAGRGLGMPGALWGLLMATYAAALTAGSVAVARRHGWPTLPYLPAVFAAYHVSYGLGFFAGLLHQGRLLRARSTEHLFTHITRKAQVAKNS
jgi:glycosyltransferase involved in cell wall biosynthesis